MPQAAIYVRVSSADQVEGFSLDVQERVCRDFCERAGWTVASVSREEGESAKTKDRTQLQRFLAGLARQGHGIDYFVVYDFSRFARQGVDHVDLQRFLQTAGVQLKSVTQPVDDSPAGRFMEWVFAGVNQLDNEMRRDRTLGGMKEAVRRGIWPWQAPLGYRRGERKEDRALEHDPAAAPLVRRAFERIATGTVTQEEVRLELRDKGFRGRNGGHIAKETFAGILRNPIYCGRIVAPKWGLESKACFRGIVSEDLFDRVQAVLDGRPLGWLRNAVRPDFPLRHWTRCAGCGRPITGSYSRGRTGAKYPYYRCTAACLNVRKEDLEESFRELLSTLACPEGAWSLFDAQLRRAWARATVAVGEQRSIAAKRLKAIADREERLLAAYIDGSGAIDADLFRRQRVKLEAERSETKASVGSSREIDFEPALAAGRRLLETPVLTWDALAAEVRPRFVRVAFPARLDYEPKMGFRTPAKSLYRIGLSVNSKRSIGEWYPQPGEAGTETTDLTELVAGWATIAPLLGAQLDSQR